MRSVYLLPAAILLAFVLPDELLLPADVERALEDVSADTFRAHVVFLADDALQGRQSDTEGYETAVRYVEKQYRQLGVLPAGDDGTYRQEVTLRSARVVAEESEFAAWTDTTRLSLSYGDDFVMLPNFSEQDQVVEAPLVFAGFGVSAPEFGHDDYADIDADGKIVLILYGTPQREFDHVVRSTLGQLGTKLETARNHGAVGVVMAAPTRMWSRVHRFTGDSVWGAVLSDSTALTRSGNPHPEIGALAVVRWESLGALMPDTSMAKAEYLYGIGMSPTASRPELNLTLRLKSSSRFEHTTSPNVVGVIPGRDPDLKSTYVVHSAHLDHVGIGRPVEGDSIYNGAHDNASGVASVLEIARVYSKLGEESRPRRSVLLLMTTAEELGLLGSAYFAYNPTVPKERIVANVNTDMPTLIAPLRSIVPLGAEHSTLLSPVQNAADYLGLEIAEDHMPQQVRFVRSDHYSFVVQGIPSLHVKYGLKTDDPEYDLKSAIDTFTKEYYHKPADQIDAPFDFEAARTYVKLNFLIGYQVAMTGTAPRWNDGDYFSRYAR